MGASAFSETASAAKLDEKERSAETGSHDPIGIRAFFLLRSIIATF
jgi:hypothetical protein